MRQLHSHSFSSHLFKLALFFTLLTLSYLAFYHSSTAPLPFPSPPISSLSSSLQPHPSQRSSLDQVLQRASMPDGTVILTNLNQAWIEPGSTFDLFLESFRSGNQTLGLLKHLVVVAVDNKAFHYCLTTLRLNCYNLTAEDDGDDFSGLARFMSRSYLKLVWRKIDFLSRVLELGYNFIFTDADIMWFRNPFPRLYSDSDFQISCDRYNGLPSSTKNAPNSGFMYVKSSKKTIEFYKFWYRSREKYPREHDQDVLNKIKNDPFVLEIGLEMKFLDTAYFGGFCQPSKDLDLVCTMHANCCVGLQKKIHDLNMLLHNWRKYLDSPGSFEKEQQPSWSDPQSCRVRKKNGNKVR